MKLLKSFVPLPLNDLDSASHSFSAPAAESLEETLAKKEKFAELSLRESNPFKVALVIYPDDTSKALRVANSWPDDPDVKAFKESLVEGENELRFLPSEADDIREIHQLANLAFTQNRLDAAQFFKMYLEMRGRIGKGQVVAQQNNTIVHNVMIVKDHGTDEQWQAKAMSQQAKLRQEALADVVSDQ